VALSQGLAAARRALRDGARSAAALRGAVRAAWRAYPLVREDYIAVVDARTLDALATVPRATPVLVAVAARVGKARLIDNFVWRAR
jgi:pantothenate synthetase